jgi:REP element-mobilizing transposase RayT
MFLMLPNDRITEIIQCWFARALCLFGDGIEIYAFIFLSNHWHALLKDTKGTLAAFMWYFQGNVAKAINRELGRKGRFWSREYDDVIVPGEYEFLNRYAYTVGNAVKAGLVNKSGDWPGWSSLEGALGDGKYSFEMLNRTKLHNATRRGQQVDESKFMENWRFELATPPMLLDKSREEQANFIKELVESAEKKYQKDRGYNPALGIDRILGQRPLDRPLEPACRPRIRVFCLDETEENTWLEGFRNFVGGYRDTFDVFRKAATKGKRPAVEWPKGSFAPSCLYPVWHQKAA